eukprot:3258548-Heterocapsa_arctica.AAC.1
MLPCGDLQHCSCNETPRPTFHLRLIAGSVPGIRHLRVKATSHGTFHEWRMIYVTQGLAATTNARVDAWAASPPVVNAMNRALEERNLDQPC